MKQKFCIAVILLLLIVPTAFANFDREAFEIFTMLNEERQKQKTAVLKWDDDLADIAEDYSEKMADKNFFSHTDPKGLTVADRVKEEKIEDFIKLGENLYYCLGCPDFKYDVVRSWMYSPAHKKNVLNKDFNMTGIGITQSKKGEIYITQIYLSK